MPPHPPRPVARAGNVPPAARQGVDNAALAGNFVCYCLYVLSVTCLLEKNIAYSNSHLVSFI